VGEIKSAIELAMEKTKNLVMDEGEKRAFARKGLEERLRALMRRFFEGMIGREEFLAEYRGMKAEKRDLALLVIDMIIEEFGREGEKDRPFELLELLGEEAGGGLAEEARALRDGFREELRADVSGVREKIMTRLGEMGISGEALEPNIEEWDEWKDAAQKRGSLFRKRLYEWKDKAERAPLQSF
jgi:hypothetical protein